MKNSQVEIVELNTSVTKIENLLERLRVKEVTEGRISELQDGSITFLN